MKTQSPCCIIVLSLLALSALNPQLSTAFAQGTAFTYQGRLNSGGSPAGGIYDLSFTLYDALTNGSAVGGPLTNTPTGLSNGLFTVVLDFGASAFPGADRWLEIGVRTNGAATFSTLSPRQKLAATPYAITAGYVTAPVPAAQLSGTLASSSLAGTYGNPVTFNNPANSFSGNGGGLTNVNAATLGGLGADQFWKTGGNSNTVAGTNFLGTVDNQPVEVRVNNTRALRVEPVGTNAPNVVWGHPANLVTPGVVGAVIGGGGGFSVTSGSAFTNRVTDSHGVVGGGLGNVAGDGDADLANARYATVGGGFFNTAAAFASTLGGGYQNATLPSATYSVIAGGNVNTNMGEGANIGGGFNNQIKAGGALSTIGGGYLNTVTANNATVAGGSGNSAAGSYAAIGGGVANTASGLDATVPGGSGNVASGDDSFAAGSAAYATHPGSFVWSDPSSSFVFGSTTTNQFSARATGGVRFETAGAGMTLDGQPVALQTGGNTFTGNQVITNGNVGIGTTTPSYPLDVNGTAYIENSLYVGVYLGVGYDGIYSEGPLNVVGNVTTGDLSLSENGPYHNLSLSGGNSTGYLYGSYAKWGDGVHLGYNYYADANGTGHIPATGGGTSRISADYGEIILAVGAVNTSPSSVRLDATTAGVTVYGTFNNLSDRNTKQDFAPVSSSQILDKVLQLPVSEWSYKEDSKTRHIGPVAQDFYSVFNIGTDDKHIAPIDEGGIAFAAIQGLNQKLEQKETEITELKRRNESLEKRLQVLERAILAKLSN